MLSRAASAYYPDFFRSDLQVGLETSHPVAAALDTLSQRLSDDCFEDTWTLQPHRMDAPLRRGFLGRLGFDVDPLSDDKVIALFERRETIFKNRATLKAIQVLAEIYLGAVEIRRGRPEISMRLGTRGTTRLLLTDTKAAGKLVFVRCRAVVDETLVTSFLKSASLLIPFSVSMVVAPPVKTTCPKIAGFSLSGDKLSPRRL